MLINFEDQLNKLKKVRSGQIKEGLKLGISEIDEHFRFKHGNFNVILGHANVGKTTVVLYLMLLYTIKHKTRWLVFSTENEPYSLIRKLVEFIEGKPINKIEEEDFNARISYINDHFKFVDPNDLYTYKRVLELAQYVKDAWNYDGLMIESHCDPKHAWTDAKQQITPLELKSLLNSLTIRNRAEIDEDVILRLRDQINQTDDQLIQLLRNRMRISEEIGVFKKDKNHVILQKNQWEEALKRNVINARKVGLSEEFVTQLFKLIHQDSIRIQSEILSKNEND